MSTGLFLSIEESFIPEARSNALALVQAVNDVLTRLQLPPITDRPEGPHICTGRTGLDHIGSRTLAELGERGGDARNHVQLLSFNPYRLVYVPRRFAETQVTPYEECIAGQDVKILCGSSVLLLEQLLLMAPELGIPLSDGALGDDVASKIDMMNELRDGESDWELIENARVAWLILHEAALLSIGEDVPISLAG